MFTASFKRFCCNFFIFYYKSKFYLLFVIKQPAAFYLQRKKSKKYSNIFYTIVDLFYKPLEIVNYVAISFSFFATSWCRWPALRRRRQSRCFHRRTQISHIFVVYVSKKLDRLWLYEKCIFMKTVLLFGTLALKIPDCKRQFSPELLQSLFHVWEQIFSSHCYKVSLKYYMHISYENPIKSFFIYFNNQIALDFRKTKS